MTLALFRNSLGVAVATSLFAGLAGGMVALWWVTLPERARAILQGAMVLVLALPAFLTVNAWMDLLGAGGCLRGLSLNLFSLPGTVFVLGLMLWPVVALLVLAAWRLLPAEYLECDPVCRGGLLVRHVLWPAARSAVGAGLGLVFVLALNQFSVPALLQVPVLPAGLWIEFNTRLDPLAALVAASPLVLLAALALWFLARGEWVWPRAVRVAPPELFRRQLGPVWRGGAALLTVVLVLFSLVLPLGQLLLEPRTWTQLPAAWQAGWGAGWQTLWMAVGTASLVVLAGWGLAAHRWPVVFWLCFLLPGVLTGIALLAVFNRPGFDWLMRGPGVVWLAFGLRYFAPAWAAAVLARQACDPALDEVARLEGAGRWGRFRHALWPQVAPRLAVAWYLVFLLVLWDVETLLLVQPPGLETIAIRIFNLLHYGHNAQVNALCLGMLALAVAPLVLWRVRPGRWRAAALLGLLVGLPGCGGGPESATPLDSRLFERVELIGRRGAGAGEFNKPRAVAVDREDNLYVADMTGRIQKFSPDGRYLLSWQMPQTDLGKAKGMGLDPDGNILILEPHYQRVNHFRPDGHLVRQWGVKGTNVGQFILPRAIAADARGRYWVSEYTLVDRLQLFAGTNFQCLLSVGQAGSEPGQFNRPEGLAVDGPGHVYVADSCNHRIQVFDSAGRFLRRYGRAGAGPGDLSYPYDIRVDAAGRQFVCEFGNSRIQILDARDQTLEIIGGPGGEPGRFSNPWSITLDSHGNLYVADAGNHRVQKLVRRSGTLARRADSPAGRPPG